MHKLKQILIISCSLLFGALAFAFGGEKPSANTEKATALANRFLQKNHAAGMAVSIGKNDVIVWSAGFGLADVEQNVPVLPARTKFRVGSVAKPLTATALAILYEQGKLDFNKTVQTYVANFPEKRWPVSVRQVAGHLAGIRHYRDQEFLSVKYYSTVAEGLEIFKNDTLLFQPGSDYRYSSYGWNLLSAVVESASGEPFLEFMQKNVTLPMGMMNTVADHIDSIIVDRSRYYRLQDNILINCRPVDNSYKWAGGGFLSTSEDLIRFGFACLNATILKRQTIDLLWQSQVKNDGKPTNYGIGWSRGEDKSGRRWVGHGGGSVGGTTFFRIYPQQAVVIAIITNMSGMRYDDLPDQLANIFLPN